MTRVYVGSLGANDSDVDLRREFGVFGTVRSVQFLQSIRGTAVVEVDDGEAALKAIHALNGKNGWLVEHLDKLELLYPAHRPRSPEIQISRKRPKKENGVEPTKLEEAVAEVMHRCLKRYVTRKKIPKLRDVEPTEFEESVAEALFDLERTIPELKSDLKGLYFDSATQTLGSAGCESVIMIWYDYKFGEVVSKIKTKLVPELEKRFTGNVYLMDKTWVRR